MTRALKGFGRVCKKSLSVIIAFSMMLSVCAVSGISVSANTTYEYDAKKDSSFNNADFVANCSYYDYLDDQELSTGTWGNVKTAGNTATWYPFTKLNSELSAYYDKYDVKKPLYFGNLNTGTMSGEDEWRRTEYWNMTNGLYNYDAAPNNSKAVYYDSIDWNVSDIGTLAGYGDPQSWSYSYQGVVSRNLKDGKLQMMKVDNYSTIDAPFFSDSFLNEQKSGTSTKIGRKVNSVLPFVYNSSTKKYSYQSSTESTHANPINGIYLENSNRNNSTNNLNGVTSSSLTMKYGGSSTSTGILDGKLWFNSGNSGYGFFPFNNNTGSHTNDDVRNDLNYGFGMALTVDFTVPTDGCIEGTSNPVEFTFTGDDDIWIFIDDKLVVDLGGNHKDASCTINFKNKTVNYSTGLNTKAVTSASDEYSISEVMNGSTGNTVHTLKMFYMERGLIESNMRVEFSFSPIDNYLTTEKVVNTANVNEGLKNAVASKDSFTFKNVSNGTNNSGSTSLSNKTYIYTQSTGVQSTKYSDNSGQYPLKHNEKASFENVTDAGNYLTVSESATSNLSYSTKYTVTDVQNNSQITSGSGTSANFKFINSKNEKQMANYNVKFENTPKVSNVEVSKTAYDTNGTTQITGEDFTFTIKVDLNGGTNYVPYHLNYTVGSSSKTASNGIFTLQGGQKAVFKNIPVGATYQIVESVNTNYTVSPSSRTITGRVGSTASTNTAQFINTKIDKSPATVVLSASKLLDGTTPDVYDFEFTLTSLTKNGSTLTADKLLQTVNNNGSKVEFEPLKFDYIEDETEPTTNPVTVPVVTTEPTTAAPVTQPTTVPKTTKTITVGVINYVYNETSSNTGDYQVHYWGGSSGTGNANCTSLGTTESRSVGADYWSNSTQTFYMYTAEIPNDATGFKFHIGDRWFGDDGNASTQNAVYAFNYSGDKALYTTVASSSAYNLIRSAYSEPSENVNIVGNNLIQAGGTELYYYEIAENMLKNKAYSYDQSKFYAVVTVNRNVTPNTASVKYYESPTDAINQTNEIDGVAVEFNNYHYGSLEITKKGVDDKPLTEDVTFKLYKTDKEGGTLNRQIGEMTVDTEGKVKFENLDIFVNQANGGTEVQWYCFVESQTKEGYNISGSKYYFTVPYSQLAENQNTADYDFITAGKKYKFVPDEDGNLVYDIKVGIDNFAVVTPDASGTGINFYLVLGVGIIGTGAMLTVAYNLYDRVQRKKRKARYRAYCD